MTLSARVLGAVVTQRHATCGAAMRMTCAASPRTSCARSTSACACCTTARMSRCAARCTFCGVHVAPQGAWRSGRDMRCTAARVCSGVNHLLSAAWLSARGMCCCAAVLCAGTAGHVQRRRRLRHGAHATPLPPFAMPRRPAAACLASMRTRGVLPRPRQGGPCPIASAAPHSAPEHKVPWQASGLGQGFVRAYTRARRGRTSWAATRRRRRCASRGTTP